MKKVKLLNEIGDYGFDQEYINKLNNLLNEIGIRNNDISNFTRYLIYKKILSPFSVNEIFVFNKMILTIFDKYKIYLNNYNPMLHHQKHTNYILEKMNNSKTPIKNRLGYFYKSYKNDFKLNYNAYYSNTNINVEKKLKELESKFNSMSE